jgi:hypothetical protein
MTTFDKREQGFEAKYIHDEELRFKAMARCNKMLGDWAASQLGLKGKAATDYASNLVTADLENQTLEASLHKVANDLSNRGVSEQQVATKVNEFLHAALEQIQSGK